MNVPAWKHRHQTGVVLVVSLIILLLMTIIGVTALSTTSLEQRMAGNVQDKQLSFQAAETAMRDAERFIGNNFITRTGPGTGVYDQSSSPALPVKDEGTGATQFDWVGGTGFGGGGVKIYPVSAGLSALPIAPAGGGTPGAVAAQPRYAIENLGTERIPDLDRTLPPLTRFRVTARGVGRVNSTRTLLQVVFGKEQ